MSQEKIYISIAQSKAIYNVVFSKRKKKIHLISKFLFENIITK